MYLTELKRLLRGTGITLLMMWNVLGLSAQSFIYTGSYTGNGVDNRSITGVGFQPDVVIIKGDNNQEANIRVNGMSGDVAKKMHGGTVNANRIQALESNGFQVGTDDEVNASGVTYNFICLKGQSNSFTTGSYVGNGVNNRAITSLWFQPQFLIILSGGADHVVYASSDMTTGEACDIGSSCGTTGLVNSLTSTGFTLGTNAMTNANGTTYYYIAGRNHGGAITSGTFSGNGSDNRNLSLTSYSSKFVLVKGSGSQNLVMRTDAMAGDATLLIDGNANAANVIQAINSTGFQVGTDAKVNTSAVTYYYAAFTEIGALPFEFISFRVRLKPDGLPEAVWATGTEDNISQYKLERSRDRLEFTEAGRVNAKGTPGPNVYALDDPGGTGGALWYRVAALKTDGSVSYSETYMFVGVSGVTHPYEFFAAPNPAGPGNLQMVFNLPPDQDFQVRIIDLNGKILLEQSLEADGNTHFQTEFPDGFEPGVYFIEAGSGSARYRIKLVHVH